MKNGSHGIHAEPRHLHVEGGPRLSGGRDEGTKGLAVEAEDRGGLHRVDAKSEEQTPPARIETGFSRNIRACDDFSFTHGLCAGANVGLRNRAVAERVDKRGWQAGKQHPVENS